MEEALKRYDAGTLEEAAALTEMEGGIDGSKMAMLFVMPGPLAPQIDKPFPSMIE